MFILLGQFGTHNPTPDYDEIAVVLRERGHKVWVATPAANGDLIANDGQKDVARLARPFNRAGKIRSLPGLRRLTRLSTELAMALRLRRFIRRHNFDIAHLNRAKLIFFWIIPLWTSNRTVYVLDWRQIGERQYKGLFGEVKQFMALQYRRIPSRYTYDQACFLHAAGAAQVLGEHWSRWATVVPLAVSSRFLNGQAEVDDLEEDRTAVRFIYIGTLSRVRRLERILLAARTIRRGQDELESFEVSFIGPDRTSGYYQALIERLDLGGTVTVQPPVAYQEIPSILKEYDVAFAYVPEYPLDWQYHPTLKALEYRAIGMPIIATDFEPNREIVQDGVNGLLVTNSPQDIAQAMERFIDDKGFLRRCKNSAQNMRQAFIWQDIGLMYEQLYERLLQEKWQTP